MGFDRAGWEERWSRVLREQPEHVAGRPPNPHLVACAEGLPPGVALDAGCGHGAETRWLAARGWAVTAVDFSATALAHARSLAPAADVEWLEADLGAWAPPVGRFDLVACVHVHVAGSATAMVERLAAAVAPGGTLLLVGREAPGQVQVSVPDALAVLDGGGWELQATAGTDAVVEARRLH
jgi:2-polyprenyl-3-methyl-5-hydroxy-6-metoxy-1,4-benzoquinol methylase